MQRATLALLLAVMPAAGCRGVSLSTGSASTTYGQADNTLPEGSAQAAMPPATASLTGLPSNATFTPGPPIYLFTTSSQAVSLVITLSSQPDSCGQVLGHTSSPGERFVSLQLFSQGLDEDEPIAGTFTVISPDATLGSTPGHYAYAQLGVRNAQCANSLGQASFARGGSIAVATHVTNGGSYVSGSLSGLTFTGGTVSGSFLAYDCDISELDSSVATTCK